MKISRILLSFILYIVLIPYCKANSESDSLEASLQKMPKDTNYVRAAEQYALKLLNYLDDEKKAEKTLREAEKIAFKINDYKGIARINCNFGYLYMRNEKHNEVLNSFQKSEIYVNKYNLSPNEKQLAFSGLGSYYEFVNQYDKAIKYFSQAIELTEKYHLNEYILPAYVIMARMYIPIDVKKYEAYIQKTIPLIKKEKIKHASYLAELALSDFYVHKKDYLKSKYHSQQSLYYAKNYCRKSSIISSWISLSSTYIKLNQPDSAYFYINKSVKLAEKLNNVFRKADAYASMAMYYEYKKQYRLSEKYNLKTLEIDKKGNYGLGVKLDYDKLADLNVLLKDYKKAHYYRVKSYKLDDSLFSIKLTMSVNKAEREKQEANLKLLKLENESSTFQRNVFLIGGILSILFGIISIVLIINRNKYKKLEAEQRLRNQIASDLHDEIGSTLSSISILSEIVSLQQKSNLVNPQIMQQVSTDAREVIDKMDDIIWTINPENDNFHDLETRLKTFAIPLFESKDISFRFGFSAELETIKIDMSKRRDIYLILKEAINNLIKYSKCKNTEIDAYLENSKIYFKISDDGIGFDVNAESLRNGLKNIKMRAEKIEATLRINSIIGKGTQVILAVKL